MPMDSINNVLFSLFRGTPQHGEWIVACLQGSWTVIVGDPLARVCRPLLFETSRLVIEILDPSWEDALRGLESDLCEKMQTVTCNEVRRIAFRTAQGLPVKT
jgi:hypothetical protein